MVSCLQYGLRELTLEFSDVRKIGPPGDRRLKTPQPRVPMPYTYLVAWFVMHCPSLMTGVENTKFNVPFVQQFKSARWVYSYIVPTRQLLLEEDSYEVYCCFPDFDRAGERRQLFIDTALNNFTSLPEGIFRWLITIRPGYLVFRLGARCIIEPYLPSRFARQFGYDQLYIGNPNPNLALVGNLYEGARAWYHWTAGNSHAAFTLPSPTPNCYTTHGFCSWFREAARIPEYDVYTSCLKDIREMYNSKKDSRKTRLRGVDEYLASEQKAQTEPKQIEVPEEIPQIEVPRERATGKRALTAEETAQYDKRVRQRITTRSNPQPEPKLMQEAIRSAPVIYTSDKEEDPPAVSDPPSEKTVLALPAISGGENIMSADESPPPVFFLKLHMTQLESMLKFAADFVMNGRGSFEAYRPRITRCLSCIEQLGGAQYLKHCTDRISLLEADLQSFRTLTQDIENAEAIAPAEKKSKQENFQANLLKKKAQVASLQEQHNQTQVELANSAAAMAATQEAIAQLEAELTHKRAQLIQEREAVENFRRQDAVILDNLHQEECVLKNITKEIDELQDMQDTTGEIRAVREQELAALKSRLTLIYLAIPKI